MNAILERLVSDVPMIQPERLAAWLVETDESRAYCAAWARLLDPSVKEPDYMRRVREELTDQPWMDGDIGVVSILGPLANRPKTIEMLAMGMKDSTEIRRQVEQMAADDAVAGLVLEVDSPGGFSKGGQEMADAVVACGKKKPVVAWVGGSMASLAYWVGCQAQAVVCQPSGSVGSIGAMLTVVDTSRLLESLGVKIEVFTNREGTYKATGAPGIRMTDVQRDYLQETVDQLFAEFKAAVKSARPQVKDESMRGQVFSSRQAKAVGLVDAIGSLDFAIAACRQKRRMR